MRTRPNLSSTSKTANSAIVALGVVCFVFGAAIATALSNLRGDTRPETNALATPASSCDDVATASSRRTPWGLERSSFERPAAPDHSNVEPAAERNPRVRQAKELMKLLRSQLAIAELLRLPGGPEASVNQVTTYIDGWVDSTLRLGPDLAEEIGNEIEGTMCDSTASPAQVMLMARVARRLPDFSNARGFDCVFDRGTEDIVLWEALDAWRIGPLPKTPALERLEMNAKDERTRRRFVKFTDLVPPEDEVGESEADETSSVTAHVTTSPSL